MVGEDDVLFAHVYLDPAETPLTLALQFHSGNWEHRAYWGADQMKQGTNGTPSRFPAGPLPKAGEWVRLQVRASDVGLKPGDVVDGLSIGQHTGGAWWDKAGIVSRIDQSAWYDSQIAWERDERRNGAIGLPKGVRKSINKPSAERSQEEVTSVDKYFLRYVWSSVEPYRTRLDQIDLGIAAMENNVPTSLVYREKAEPKPAHLLRRGEYDQKGDVVERGTPAVLPPLPKDAPANRLGLARWLTSPEHPLTSRVAVNRFWQQFFGTGLVKTSEDFGSQGEPPSHPDLLDWMSAEFIDPQEPGASHRWDVKHLMRHIVMSEAYRRAATVTKTQLQLDPRNRLFARGPRFRLDAETLRDQALFVSGLLYEKLGGPSVKPPQPEGLWKVVGFTGSDTAIFKADVGHEAVHRRTLYTFVKRTSPPPQMSTFDAPSRESCVIRRERSNSPMQALLLMNDPQYVECARGLAERVLDEAGSTTKSQAAFLLRQCVLRQPTEDEVRAIVEDYQLFHEEYTADPERANALIAIGDWPPPDNVSAVDLASWTMMANLVLNLDEIVNK